MNNNKKIIIYFIIFFIFCFFITPGFSISTAVKADMDYKSIFKNLHFFTITIENFADEAQKNKFEEIKALFKDASAELYGQRYENALEKYNKVKENLFQLMDPIALVYLKRSKEILDSTAKPAFDIIIKYSKNSTFSNNFKHPFDPFKSTKNYDEKKYHFYYDSEKIENYLYNGYKTLTMAKNSYNDKDFKYLKNLEKKTRTNLDSILKKYIAVITLCRKSKMYGIEIYKIFNDDKTGDILIKYNIKGGQIDPVLDERIPDNYKIDAVDNEKMIFSEEKNKLRQ